MRGTPVLNPSGIRGQRWLSVILVWILVGIAVHARPAPQERPSSTASLLLLHTNDIHDILKAPRGNTLGGIAYVSGYIHQVRAMRDDVVALDAGDILEKGDFLGLASKGEASYRALGAVGYDATVPGNHDFVFGMGQLRRNIEASGIPMLCANIIYEDTKEFVFQPSREIRKGGVRIGLIGASVGRDNVFESGRRITTVRHPELGKRIASIAAEVNHRTDIQIVVLHGGTWAAQAVAKAVPEVDVVVAGHTNEVTTTPMVAPTGALIVEVGRAGQWVGSLDMVVDLDAKKIASYQYRMIPMDRKKIPEDKELTKRLEEWEKQFCPEGGDGLSNAPKKQPRNKNGRKGP
ncbi:MAG: metallophosphoesterase [Candidatus Sumerlaeia bacterium]|nr:metallophosphoesterase [Candidatus Sumerlaeia bacterium]